MTSTTSVGVCFEKKEMIILGTEYNRRNEERSFYNYELHSCLKKIFFQCIALLMKEKKRYEFVFWGFTSCSQTDF